MQATASEDEDRSEDQQAQTEHHGNVRERSGTGKLIGRCRFKAAHVFPVEPDHSDDTEKLQHGAAGHADCAGCEEFAPDNRFHRLFPRPRAIPDRTVKD
jgi:hypothetical protein